MKKIFRNTFVVLAGLLMFLGGASHASAGSVLWNTWPLDWSTPTRSKVSDGTNLNWNVSTNAGNATRVSVIIWYHNTGDPTSTNTRVSISNTTGSARSSYSISGKLWSDNSTPIYGNTTINFNQPVTLTFVPGSVRVYRWKGGANQVISYSGSETDIISSSGLNFGSVPGINTCPVTDDYCEQGTVVASFDVSSVATTYQCNDGIDNDSDGYIDYPNDPGCTSSTDNDEYNYITHPACSDGIDNDGDGLIDYPNDPGCYSSTDTDEYNYIIKYACNDGLDNDGDGLVDYPNDLGCYSPTDTDEYNYVTVKYACNDGIDNDGDGYIDYPNDPGCYSSTDTDEYNYITRYACNDGLDNDGDGLVDYPNDLGCYSYSDTDEYNYTAQCSITSFYATPTTVTSGQNTTLYWSTTGCTGAYIDGVYYPANGSGTFGPLYTGRTYRLQGIGSPSPTRDLWVGVNTVQNYCTINSFYATPTSVTSGSASTLTWSTSNCTNVSISNISSYLATSGSIATGAIYGTTNYTITASNTTNTASPQTVSVSVTTPVATNVITSPATSITSSSARLNGLAISAGNNSTTLYFEWGRTTALGFTTSNQTTFSSNQVAFYDTITGLTPNTTYYFRAVAQNGTGTYRGDTLSFTTPSAPIITPRTPAPVVIVERGIGQGTNLVQLTYVNNFQNGFTNQTQNICVDDIASFTVTYKNISTIQLTNAILHVDLPKDISFRSTSSGIFNASDNTITMTIGTLSPNQEGSVTFSGLVLKSAADRDLLVVTSTLSFENPVNNARETAIAYALASTQNCVRNNLAGLALFGNGFFPTTLIGWLFLILIILVLIYVSRMLYLNRRTKKARPYYEHMDVPTAPYHN